MFWLGVLLGMVLGAGAMFMWAVIEEARNESEWHRLAYEDHRGRVLARQFRRSRGV